MADDTGSAPPASHGPDTSTVGTSAGGFVSLKSGLAIRHYVIEEVIGAGGFGITYRARHQRLSSKIFALKEFFPRQFAARQGTHVISTPDGKGLFRWGLDRFLKEAEALAKCEHPGIVDVVDYFEENGTAYAVLGYVEGRQLGQWLDELGRPPTQAELDRILMPLLDALEVVHAAKLLHRDIAPDNILIRRDGSPCLIDFGACREDIRERSQKISAIVKHGYSPPEQYHGVAELQGPWTDIYAVAATLYRAISGAPPTDSSRRGALGDDMKPVSEMTTIEYRAGFLSAIDTALRLKPQDRPQSIPEWRSMLLSDQPATAGAQATQHLTQSALPATTDHAGAARQRTGTARGPAPASERPVSDLAAGTGSSPIGTPRPAGKAPLLATLALLVLLAAGAAAWWRSSSSSSTAPSSPPAAPQVSATAPSAPTPAAQSPADAKTSPAAPKPTSPVAPTPVSPPDPERVAEAAWRPISDTQDPAVLERFLATHGQTRIAASARTRLAALREAQSRNDAAERAKAEAAARADRQRSLDSNWEACRNAADASKAATCAPVVESDDTLERRASALHMVANAARRSGDLDKAIADYTRSLGLVPDNAQVLTDRGIAHVLKGGAAENEAAMRDYEAALRIDPRHAEALNNKAWSLFQSGRTAEALADANRSIEASPTNGYAYDTRGQILEALGRREDAIRDYERAIAIDPAQSTSRAGLARLKATSR
ncbi:MAG: tetratricopeptide repeat protein [Hyphomicrobiaceae bacterium]